MSPLSAPSLPGNSLTATHGSDRQKLSAVARQFEAIFVRQMLSAARKTDFDGDELFGGKGLETFRQMQEEHFAGLAAERGAFGIARMVEAQLAARPDGGAG